MEAPTLGIAIVGCGQIMTHHVAAMAAHIGLLQVNALCDPSPQRREAIKACIAEKGTAVSASLDEFDSLDALLADSAASARCPVVMIAVPHDLHEPIAAAALAAGKDVVLEKPLAPTLASCRALQRAAAAASGLLIVAEQSPYWQEVALAKKLITEGAIGSVVSAAAYYFESMRDNVTSGLDAGGGLGWRCSLARAGGGIVIDGGLHWIRPLRELCGDICSVVGATRRGFESDALTLEVP